ncbi:oligosaccharide flippase family protein [Flavobacterium psychrotolerans]|uniref:Polysaccharide biosynthesis protein n=1 Tax=Flavobacterium psychrotolerans TaxID=2169410 RepID=A0A2U1JPQ2_9FLAO|nr:oligosaccharide flippase family protein [Flavobacterium psychrotolerans]PWA06873.1 hypothetical protein DB895_02505 [Flavobacterium psychrotolerans]
MIVKKLINHSSLLVIIAGAGGFFLTNIILKEILSTVEFGQFSLVVTYLSLMYIFGIFGFEQVFIRLSEVKEKNVVTTQIFQLKTIIKISLFSSILGTVLFKILYSEIEINYLLLFLASYSITALMQIFTIFRLNSDFFIAQIIVNFWKIALFLISIYTIKFQLFFSLTNTLLIIIVIGFLVAIFVLKKKINFDFNENFSKKEILEYFFQFFFSILIFSFLTFGDRFVFNEMFGINEFGDYYYLSNFFLAPFSIFQNYIGFKHIVRFKESFNLALFKDLIRKILLFGIFLILFLILVTYFIDYYKLLNFNFKKHTIVILLLLLIGLTKLYYAAIAALFEATASKKTLKSVNLYFLGFLIMIGFIIVFFIKTIVSLISIVLLVWIFRCFIFRLILFKQIKKD